MKYGYFLFFYLVTLQINTTPLCKPLVTISSKKGITLTLKKGTIQKKVTKPLSITLCDNDRHILLNGAPLQNGVWRLVAHTGKMSINNTEYFGPAILRLTPSQITIAARKQDTSTVGLMWQYGKKKHKKNRSPVQKQSKNIIRALVHEIKPSDQRPVMVTSTGFMLYDKHNPHIKYEIKDTKLAIQYKKNTIWINGKSHNVSHLHIIPKNGYSGINEHTYCGSLSLVKNNDRLLMVNHVDLEEYVYAVLKTESWPGWPVEVNKAFAIASRSYALAMIKQANIQKLPYHIKNTNAHQTYQGTHSNQTIRQAIEQTRSICLTYNNEPILAMFDSCCGGVIPAHIDDFDFTKVPYLARTYPCKHCKRCRIYSWQNEFPLPIFNQRIGTILNKPASFKDLKIAKKDKAGLVKEVHLKGKNSQTISGKQLYGAMKEIKSFCYTVKKKKDTLLFSGRGYGHHIGICQWGAREMVRDGWHYKRILNFYYPGTTLMKLT